LWPRARSRLWTLRNQGTDYELRQLLSSACRLIAAITEFQREAPGRYPLPSLTAKAIALQHRTLSLSPPSPSTNLAFGNLADCIFQIVRLATFIFSDFVFFPTAEARNGRQRLATIQKDHLTSYCKIYSAQLSKSPIVGCSSPGCCASHALTVGRLLTG